MLQIEIDGAVYHLGNNHAPVRLQWRVYGEHAECPLVPRSEWRALVDAMGAGPDYSYLPKVADQNGYGMCNASMGVDMLETCRLKAGLPPVSLSAGDLYRRICGGSDRGSILEDGLDELVRNGVASTQTVDYLDWRNDRRGASEERRSYRVLEAFLCPTFDAMFSAALMGFSVGSGIMWHSNYKPGSSGWLPKSRSGGGGGHAIHGFKPTYEELTNRTSYGIWHKNSWAVSWGYRGCCAIPEEAYEGPVGGWWAVRSVVDTGGDLPTLKR